MKVAEGRERTPPVVFGVVLGDLADYPTLVRRLAQSPRVTMTDFAFSAPIYKGNEAIKAGLSRAESGLDKFDIYCTHAILDEVERVRFARLFAAQFLRRFPSSERSDVFVASGDVLRFSFELGLPFEPEAPPADLSELEQSPHDPAVLEDLRAGRAVDPVHLRGELKIFLDHVFNPRRHELVCVKDAAREVGVDRPVILELVTDGALPFFVSRAVEACVRELGGRLVLLPG